MAMNLKAYEEYTQNKNALEQIRSNISVLENETRALVLSNQMDKADEKDNALQNEKRRAKIIQEMVDSYEAEMRGQSEVIHGGAQGEDLEVRNMHNFLRFVTADESSQDAAMRSYQETRAALGYADGVDKIVPKTFLNEIETKAKTINPLLSLIRMTSIPNLSLPTMNKVGSAANNGMVADDKADNAKVDFTPGIITWGANEFAVETELTKTLVQTSLSETQNELRESLGEEFALATLNAMFGAGTEMAHANFDKKVTAKLEAEAATFIETLYKAFFSLHAKYRPNAKIAMNPLTFATKILPYEDKAAQNNNVRFLIERIELVDSLAVDKAVIGDFSKYHMNFNRPLELEAEYKASPNRRYHFVLSSSYDAQFRQTEAFIIVNPKTTP